MLSGDLFEVDKVQTKSRQPFAFFCVTSNEESKKLLQKILPRKTERTRRAEYYPYRVDLIVNLFQTAILSLLAVHKQIERESELLPFENST